MSLPSVKLSKGIHVMHLFYNVDRAVWKSAGLSGETLKKVQDLCARFPGPAHPSLRTYANIGAKADLVCFLSAAELGDVGSMHREFEAAFPEGALKREYSFLSVTELPEYVTTDEDVKLQLAKEGLAPGSADYEKKFQEHKQRQAQYEHYRLYPELPDWEVMAFYPMSKRRQGEDNWYSLSFEDRKKLMAGHARVGRKFAGRISQLITGATGIDDWEWGVTLMAHQTDALKEIVYEMRFDEVSARYGEFGKFFVNLRLQPEDLWKHLVL